METIFNIIDRAECGSFPDWMIIVGIMVVGVIAILLIWSYCWTKIATAIQRQADKDETIRGLIHEIGSLLEEEEEDTPTIPQKE